MRSSTARAPSKPTTRATNSTTNATERGRASPARTRASPARTRASPARAGASPARNRAFLTKTSTMSSPEPSPPITAPRRSTSSAPIRQQSTTTRIPTCSGTRASPQVVSRGVSPPLNSLLEGNSPGRDGKNSMSTTRILSPSTVRGTSPARNSISSSPQKQILSQEFLSRTSKSRGQSQSLNRSIDEPTALQLRRHSAPSIKLQDYMSKSHDHGSSPVLNQGGPKSLSTSQDTGFMSKSQDRGFMSKSHDRGFMSKSQDRGFMPKSQDRESRKATMSEYGYDGRRKSTSSRDAASQAPRLSSASQGGLNRRDGVSLHLQMGRSIDSNLSLSTATSSPIRVRQSSRDAHGERRLIPLQLSDPILSQGYRSGDLTPEEASPLDGRVPASTLRGGTKHRQLKSPDFFDVKKLDGDGGVITAVSRMHHKSNGLVQRTETMGASSEEDQDANAHKLHSNSEQTYHEQRRDSLANSARKAFSVETDSAIGSSHFSSEINFKLENALNGAQDLLEIGSWNDDDEEYLRIYKHERTVGASFVDIMEDKTSDSVVAVANSNHTDEANTSPKKWGQFSKIPEVSHLSQYDNALYQKSDGPDSDLGTSTQASPQASPPRTTTATQPAAVSRIYSASATSIDLNRSTDTTCSTNSQYDNAFWADPPINATFRPWNPKSEAEMTPAVPVPTRPKLPMVELAQEPPVLSPREPVANAAALGESRMPKYNDGLERLTTYMKTASQTARKKRGLSDDMSSSQASGCFDYLVDFLESQTSITDVLVSAHDETLKLNDFAHSSAAAAGGAHINLAAVVKRLDSKMTNDTAMLSSNRSIESRITDLGSEASWESGKSRSVQTLGTTGKVMDQITEKVDSLSFDSPKHLSTFKFGLKKTTLGACETITSSDQAAKPDAISASLPPSRADSDDRFFPQRKSVSIPLHQPQSPNLSWPSQTAPSSINPSRNPSQNPSRNPSRSPSRRAFSDEKLAGEIGHRLPSPLSTSIRQIKVVSEADVESRREDEAMAMSPSSGSDNPPVAETFPTKIKKRTSVERLKAAEGSTSPTVKAPSKNVQMHNSRDGSSDGLMKGSTPGGLVQRDRDNNLSLRLDQANKGCGCNIL